MSLMDARMPWIKFLAFAVFINVWIVMINSSSCLYNEMVLTGQYLQDSSFKKLQHYSVYSCAAECYGYIICRSFNFDKVIKTCSLNYADKTMRPSFMKQRSEFLYSSIESWPKSIAGPCKDHTCARDERCIAMRNQSTTCVSSSQQKHDPFPMRFSLYDSESATKQYKTDFAVVEQKRTWTDSVEFCSSLHGRLAVTDTEEKATRMKEIILAQGLERCWLGGTDVETEGSWMWINGDKMTYAMWSDQNEPNNLGNQDCLVFDNDFKFGWNDLKCKAKHAFACEVIVEL